MATLKYRTRKGRINAAGLFPVMLTVTKGGVVRFINTGIELPDADMLVDGRVTGIENEDMMNRKLEQIMAKAEELMKDWDFSGWSCTELTERLRNELYSLITGVEGCFGVADLFDYRICKYREEGNNSYADIHEDIKKVIVAEIGNYPLEDLTRNVIRSLHDKLVARGYTPGGIAMKMAKFKAALKEAVLMGWVKYLIFPFEGYKMRVAENREMDITREEFLKIKNYVSTSKRVNFARDIFLLSFYCYGMNIADLLKVSFRNFQLSFVRQKTRNMKTGNKDTLLTIPKEAREVLGRITDNNRVLWPCKATREDILSYVNRGLRLLRAEAGIDNKLSSYTARKTFCQFAFVNGTPVDTIKYCIGQSFEADYSICNVNRIMQRKAQDAMQKVISYIDKGIIAEY